MNTSRRLVFGILITVATGAALGRIASAQLVFEPAAHRDERNPKDRRRVWPTTRPPQMPTFSSNDRSRWATIRSLVDDGTFVVGTRPRSIIVATGVATLMPLTPLEAAVQVQAGYYVRTTRDQGIIFEPGWQSVDKVLHPQKLEFYSSKPPLFSTLLAALYGLLKLLFGWTFQTHSESIVRTILILVNVIPFALYVHQIGRLTDDFSATEWGRYYVVAAAAFGTLVTPFLVTLNNHTIATYCVLFALVSVIEVWRRLQAGRSTGLQHAAAGFFAAFAVCNEMPALAFAAAVFALLAYWEPRRALVFFLGAAALPAIGFFATNYAAVGQWRPAYSEFGSPWYEYEGSHWRKPFEGQTRTGIDWARLQESRGTYVFHMLLGHHGLFSLTPLWLLALCPMFTGTLGLLKRRDDKGQGLPWFVAPLALVLTLVVVGFYAIKSDNYGGFTVGLRWLMWLSPLWLLCLLPVADRLGTSRIGRGLAYFCLCISVLTANYSPWNPWRHPWLYDLMVSLGWKGY